MWSSHPVIGKKIQSREFGLQTFTKKWLGFRHASLLNYIGIYNGLYFDIKLNNTYEPCIELEGCDTQIHPDIILPTNIKHQKDQ